MTNSRTQRKETTRAALLQAADDLFERLGLEDTTLEQVAAKAGLHVQTLYRHFPSKSDLAAAIDQRYLERFLREVEQRDPAQDIFAFWRDWIDRSSREATRRGSERHRRALRNVLSSTATAFASSFLRISHQYEEALTRELAADLGVDPEQDSTPRLVACMLWAGNVNAARRWALSDTKQSLNEICVTVVDDVAALFQDRVKRAGSRTRRATRDDAGS
jgi:AcrR family transcriptional regulator